MSKELQNVLESYNRIYASGSPRGSICEAGMSPLDIIRNGARFTVDPKESPEYRRARNRAMVAGVADTRDIEVESYGRRPELDVDRLKKAVENAVSRRASGFPSAMFNREDVFAPNFGVLVTDDGAIEVRSGWSRRPLGEGKVSQSQTAIEWTNSMEDGYETASFPRFMLAVSDEYNRLGGEDGGALEWNSHENYTRSGTGYPFMKRIVHVKPYILSENERIGNDGKVHSSHGAYSESVQPRRLGRNLQESTQGRIINLTHGEMEKLRRSVERELFRLDD